MQSAATWMDLKTVILSKVTQKKTMISVIRGNRKRIQMNLSTKEKDSYRYRKQIYVYEGVRINWKIGIDTYTYYI